MTHERNAETIALVGGSTPVNRPLMRLVRLAAGFRHVVNVQHPAELSKHPNATVVLCWAQDAAAVADHCERYLPHARMVVWIPTPLLEAFELASAHPRIGSILAWPEGSESPSAWQLALAVRRLALGDHSPLALSTTLQWEGIGKIWYPHTTRDLFTTLDDLTGVLEQAGLDQRVARRIIGVAHEMLMNAMYDAPTDNGHQRFAHDRTQEITLDPAEAPSLVARTDGLSLALRVVDPFGGLRRENVFNSLVRGLRSSEAKVSSAEVLDTSGGGAGLGLHRIICESSSTVFDVVNSRTTSVTSTFDLGQPNRERRRYPKSLLFFQRGAGD